MRQEPEDSAWQSVAESVVPSLAGSFDEEKPAPKNKGFKSRASLSIGRMNFMEDDDDAGAKPGARRASVAMVGSLNKTQYFCLELWRATPELLALPKEERVVRVVEELLVSSDGPFAPDALTSVAPISFLEAFCVQAFYGMALGGPVALLLYFVYAVAVRSLFQIVGVFAFALVLAFHPLPKRKMFDHFITLAFYKYFSYRMVWTDDLMAGALKEVTAWCGCSVPHGVFPIGTWLNGIAVSAFMEGNMMGGSASVVLHTPFLRYISMFGHMCDVSAKTLRGHIDEGICVTVVADGIAGIFCEPGGVALKERKGLAKLSLQGGFPLVPTFCFGSTEAYSTVQDPCGAMARVSRMLKTSLFCFCGSFGPVPRRVRMLTAFGPVVVPPELEGDAPSPAEIDEMHARLLASIQSACDSHKVACGYGDMKLKFV